MGEDKEKEMEEKPSASEGKNEDTNVEETEVAARKTSQTKTIQAKTSEEEDEVLDGENAEDAEDSDNDRRHAIPILDYEAMSMDNLVGELQKLVRNEKVQSIKKHVDGIKYEFDQKFDDFLEGKKEKFIESGGNEIDFRYNSTTKNQFNEVYNDYREKRNQYYKNLEKNLKENLSERLAIIEELKGLTSVEEDMGSTYKAFKDLQEKWRNAGPIPRDSYNNVWRTYRHHTEIFYDFLHLNREMRDLDFKRNFEEKEKLVQRAEALSHEPDLNRVFRELQALHKIWKEDIGPVGQAHREEIWERFSNASKVLHQRRQDYYKELEATYGKNLENKIEIIAAITALGENVSSNHRELQKQINQLEVHRKAFFKAGKVPRNANQKTWAAFKDAVRSFNRTKNAYYKNLKQEEQGNLDKKRELVNLANSLKDSEDFETVTPKMKRIQADWKKIGHVPRKYSDKIWKEFKNACNQYFDRLNALKNEGREEEEASFEKKTTTLKELLAFEPSGERDGDLEAVKSFIEAWKSLGRVPFKKKNIDQRFNEALDGLFKKMGLAPQKVELLKYGNKIQQLANGDNEQAIQEERSFIRKKIEETQGEIRQLETNLQFFSNASDDNPLLQDVVKRVDVHKAALDTWKAKLKKLNIMNNSIQRELEESEESEES
ncbi:DUF349 domain-containing protein [Pricia sp.]|uniref:DUF349 domain-containing protein n=1 Tax=Pricia sp. TaxID=2268138 RepID=UPI0035936DF1